MVSTYILLGVFWLFLVVTSTNLTKSQLEPWTNPSPLHAALQIILWPGIMAFALGSTVVQHPSIRTVITAFITIGLMVGMYWVLQQTWEPLMINYVLPSTTPVYVPNGPKV